MHTPQSLSAPLLGWTVLPEDGLSRNWLNRHRYAVVEAEQLEQLPSDWPSTRLAPKRFADNEGLMPALLDIAALKPEQGDQLHALLAQAHQDGEASPVSALLQSQSSPTALLRHLCDAQVYRYHLQTAWLRVFDSRVWVQLPRVLGDKAWNRLFGPISCWSVSLYGAWVETRPSAAGLPGERDTEQRWQAMQRVGAINRALLRSGWLELPAILEKSGLLDQLTLKAQTVHGLGRIEDQVTYAQLGAEYGWGFDEHPIARSALAGFYQESEAERADATIVDVLAALDDAQWQTIRRDLAAS
ncbi:hypothetical protein [Chromobacterium sp. Beijing]|uniref:hypothetical protein n=1 Tax=Chromobacterium sp. Beijing TaxID=2735795 RepID=UPI001F2B3B9C|nr:hypothetical protein [Chromobacterium sp. Beijing]UJB30810.1 hypothetical protein HQN78_06925 [Chromobacterium sp. Beijing]